MADVKKSKTNVTARQEAKQAQQLCRLCGNPIQVVMQLTPSGRKQMVRKCCGANA
ncbi:MAG: hypothetical protein NT029_20845 [Armatimonadetes bacterium]|nr:hypothetical protein [Armatimonadota bacterium]